jgi:hypothetical protein
MELTFTDKAEITELVHRYATSIDQRDWSMFRSIWTLDVLAEYDEVGTWQGVDDFATFMEQIHARCGDTLHRLSNVVVWAEDGRVRARTYVDAIIIASDTHAMRAVGSYEDELVATDDGWRIAHRHFRKLFMRSAPIAEAI